MAYTLLDEEKLCRIYQDTEKVLDKTLAHIVQLLDGEHQTVATAESCTGGLLSQKITSVAGASHVFELGLCTYAERMKTKLLGVPAELIAEKGVVSAEVASAMVQGLRTQAEADLCLSGDGTCRSRRRNAGTASGNSLCRDPVWQTGICHAPAGFWRYGLHTREEIRHGAAVCIFGVAERILMEETECRKKKKPL